MRIHTDELDIDDALVRQLVVEQFPDWAELPLERAGDGTVNVIYRLGDELALRLPRRNGPEAARTTERRGSWLRSPPACRSRSRARSRTGRPGAGYPWFWSVHTWLEGALPDGPLPAEEVAALIRSAAGRRPPRRAGARLAGAAGRSPRSRSTCETRSRGSTRPERSSCGSEAAQAPQWERAAGLDSL